MRGVEVGRNANQPDRDRFEFQRPLRRVEMVPCCKSQVTLGRRQRESVQSVCVRERVRCVGAGCEKLWGKSVRARYLCSREVRDDTCGR